MTDYQPQIIGAAARIDIDPREMLACVEAVSLTRRSTVEWSEHDVEIAESCVGALLASIKRWRDEMRYEQSTRAQRDPAHQDDGASNV